MPITEEELSFIPKGKREQYVRLINEGPLVAAHVTQNGGTDWRIPRPDKEIIRAINHGLMRDKE